VIAWMIEALIASALLMLAVLIARGPVRRAFGPGVAYALWALPALRLILPPLPQFHAWREAATPAIAQTFTVYVIEPLGGSAAAPESLVAQLGFPLAVLWGAGAAAFLVWHGVRHWAFCRRMIAGSIRTERAGAVDVIETEAASGPLAFGIFRRYVAFPRDFAERYDDDERALALAHELGHHQRGDLIANWIALGVLALHWFNPLAWRAFRAFRIDQEMANDARVLAGRSVIERHAYACAIVKAAHGGAVSAACHLHTIHDLKGRLRMLTTGPRSRARIALGGTAVAALMIAGLAGTASGTAAAATVRAGVEKATGIDIAKLDSSLAVTLTAPQSAPPAPPAPPEGADLPPPPPPPPGADLPPAPGERVTRNRVKIVRLKDGKPITWEWSDKDGKWASGDWSKDMVKNIPEVRSANCMGNGDDNTTVVNRSQGGKKVVIICTDRIQRMASVAADQAARAQDVERMAYGRALEGLRSARERLSSDSSLSGEKRREALEGIDEAIRDLEADRAKAD